MTRNVVEFLEENMGQMGINLEEGWGNLVEEYFSGDDVAALQVIVLSCSPSPKTSQTPSNPIFNFVSKVIVGADLLLIYLPYWIYHCITGNTAQC